MKAFKRFLVFVWKWLFESDSGFAPVVKNVALGFAVVIDGCGGMKAGDAFPMLLLVGFCVINIACSNVAWKLHDRAVRRGSKAVESDSLPYQKWYKATFLFSALAVIIFATFFRIGMDSDRYYDHDQQKFVEVSPINFMPYWRYEIITYGAGARDLNQNNKLVIKQRVGSAQVDVNVKLMARVDEDQFIAYAIKNGPRTGEISTSDMVSVIGNSFAKDSQYKLSDMTEPMQKDFPKKYGDFIKSYFASKGLEVYGRLFIVKVEIWPHQYDDEGEPDGHDCSGCD